MQRIVALLLLPCTVFLFEPFPAAATPFQNLDFEKTDGVQNGIPDWVIPPEIDYLYDAIFAGEGSVTLYTNSFFAGTPLIEGEQSVLMIYDPIGSNPPTGGAITQLGDVPLSASRIEMLVTNVQGLRVSLNGVNIPLNVIGSVGNSDLVSGNVSAFAGTTALLRIASPFGEHEPHASTFDAIQFIVPEPASVALAAFGLIGLAAWGRRRTR